MTRKARGPAAAPQHRFTSLTCTLLCLALLVVLLALPVAAQDPAGSGFIKNKINAEFSFSESDWTFHPAGSDYFWDFVDMKMSLYATSNGCDIDMFMMLEEKRVGFIGTYMVSLENYFLDRGGEAIEAVEEYERWPGDKAQRVVGRLSVQGPADKVGAMHSRAGTVSGKNYRNIVFMVLNDMNLLRMTFSAPVSTWAKPECAGKVERVLDSFTLKGEPDPREDRVIEGMGHRIVMDRTNGGNTTLPTNPETNTNNTTTPESGNNGSTGITEDTANLLLEKLGVVDKLADQVKELSDSQKKLSREMSDLKKQVEENSNGGPEDGGAQLDTEDLVPAEDPK